MKVVLFCGGLGTRLGEYSETVPKPMVDIGYRPLMWHLMRYYAHYGHKDFILCLGYKGDYIKKYFLEYNECMSNDFVYARSGKDIHLYNQDIEDWKITFVDTGVNAALAQRLSACDTKGEEEFMANYSRWSGSRS
jgi:glucose-1-phosphate cytidylyltransferase